jgi:broad specificity phosphatase PhoE
MNMIDYRTSFDNTIHYDTIIKVQLLVVSPLHRTLQTATLCFPFLLGKVPWVAIDLIREQTGQHPCDKRSPISTISKLFVHVNFDQIKDDEDPLYDLYILSREPSEHVEKRGFEFLNWIASCREEHIIVVTHSAFLRHFFDACVECDDIDKEKYENCEMRTYELIVPDSRNKS